MELITQPNNLPKYKKCFLCSSQENKLKKCASCKSAYYCSKECQMLHWKIHKIVCKQEQSNNYLDNIFDAICARGVLIYSIEPYTIQNITDFDIFIKQFEKLLRENENFYRQINDLTKGIVLSKAITEINKFNAYYRRMKNYGVDYKVITFDEWKSSIETFDINTYIKKIKKKQYIRVDNRYVFIENGVLNNPTDSVLLTKLNKDYIDSFSTVFEHIDKNGINNLTLEVFTYEKDESYIVYHHIVDGTTNDKFVTGRLFFSNILFS